MANLEQKITVVIDGRDEKFKAAARSAEKEVDRLKGKAKSASSDLSKIADNAGEKLKGRFSNTGLGGFVDDLTAGTGALGSFIGPATLAAGAVVGIGAAAVGTGAALFNLARFSAEFGSAIFDVQQKTGLAAETLSALQFQAEQSGSSLDTVAAGAAKFAKVLGEARDGNEKAVATLKALNVTSYDLDTALGQAYKTISETTEGTDQLVLAQKAFGKSGADLLPFIKSFDGDLSGLVKRARELGVTLTEEDIKAADDFGDTLDTLGYQFKAAAAQIGLQFAPTVTSALGKVSKALSEHKDDIRAWGNFIDRTLQGIQTSFNLTNAGISAGIQRIGALLRSLGVDAQKYQGQNNPALMMVDAGPNNPFKKWLDSAIEFYGKGIGGGLSAASMGAGLGGDLKNYKGVDEFGEGFGKSAAKSLKNHVEKEKFNPQWSSETLAAFARNMGFNAPLVRGKGRASGGHNTGSLHYQGRAYDLGLGGTNPGVSTERLVKFLAEAIQSGIRVVDERVRPKPGAVWSGPHIHTEENDKRPSFFNPALDYGGFLPYLKELDAMRVAGKGTKSIASALAPRKLAEDVDTLGDSLKRMLAAWTGVATEEYLARLDAQNQRWENLKEILVELGMVPKPTEFENFQKMLADPAMTLAIKERAAALGLTYEEYKKLIERNAGLQILAKGAPADTVKPEPLKLGPRASGEDITVDTTGIKDPNPFGEGFFGATGLGKIQEEADVIKSVYKDMGAMVGDTVGEMIGGVGQLVESWVLYGDLGPDAVRKMTASILAGLASEAAVKSIFQVAEGIVALTNPFTAWRAPMHFKAAALYGAIAVGAGLAGRAVAGDAFSGGKRDQASAPGYQTAGSQPFYNTSNPQQSGGVQGQITALADSVNALTGKIGAMSPGSVLVAGSKEKSGYIANTATRELRGSQQARRDLGLALGMT